MSNLIARARSFLLPVIIPKMRMSWTQLSALSSQSSANGAKSPSKSKGKKSKAKSEEGESPKAAKTAAAQSQTQEDDPKKDMEYKNPEFYSYTPMSFYDLQVDMDSMRLPQPSAEGLSRSYTQ